MIFQGVHLNTHHLINVGMTFVQAMMNLDQSLTNDYNTDHQEYKTSIEKDQAMKITR